MTRNLKLTLLATAAAVVFAAGSASAYNIYFGQDLGLGEGTPLPVASRVNSTAAQNYVPLEPHRGGHGDLRGLRDRHWSAAQPHFPGAGTATLDGTGSIPTVTPGTTNGVGRYAISGSNFWEVNRQLHASRSVRRSRPSVSGVSTSVTSTVRSRWSCKAVRSST